MPEAIKLNLYHLLPTHQVGFESIVLAFELFQPQLYVKRVGECYHFLS